MQCGAESLANPGELHFARVKEQKLYPARAHPMPGVRHGALADMGETAEFEKLNTLEARLAAALDRIATGLGEAVATAPLQDPAMTSGAMEEAVIRAQIAEARLAELEARLSAAQAPAEDLNALAAERDSTRAQLEAQDAAHQAYRDEAARILAARDAELAQLQTALAQAQAAAEVQVPPQDSTDAPPIQEDAAVMAMRAEIKDLQQINARLIKNINRLRSEAASDPAILNKALVVELDALRALRASEAAELTRILADLDATEREEGADA
jgi:DNA repair exonuclease SbcCD ATPase subunit